MFRIKLALCGMVACGLGLATGCQSGNGGRTPMPSRDIKTVMESHVDDLMALPGVVGVAIGALEDGTPCIKVYVVDRTEELMRKIPRELEGHPVILETSGEIRPMSRDGS